MYLQELIQADSDWLAAFQVFHQSAFHYSLAHTSQNTGIIEN